MRSKRILVSLAVVLALAVAATAKLKFPIHKCAVPFNEDPTDGLTIDRICGINGTAHDDATKAQDALKNNLCAADAPQSISIGDLVELQSAVDAAGLIYGNPHDHGPGPPPDRTLLSNLPALASGKSLREGQVVSLVAFIVESHYSPRSSSSNGESSNCDQSDHDMVDIHVALSNQFVTIHTHDPAAQKDKKLCKTVSAEIIPHLRPEVWQNDWIQDVLKLQRPVRITGQLFFDGSHHPCTGDTPHSGDPARATSWEIHPVYKIEVCKNDSLQQCGSAASNWQAISEVSELQGGGNE